MLRGLRRCGAQPARALRTAQCCEDCDDAEPNRRARYAPRNVARIATMRSPTGARVTHRAMLRGLRRCGAQPARALRTAQCCEDCDDAEPSRRARYAPRNVARIATMRSPAGARVTHRAMLRGLRRCGAQ